MGKKKIKRSPRFQMIQWCNNKGKKIVIWVITRTFV